MNYIELLCTSPVRGKVVQHFAANPGQSIRCNVLAKLICEDRSNVFRMLRLLEHRGFLKKTITKDGAYYSISPDFPCIQEFQQLARSTS